MSMASSSPKHALDRVCIGKADDQPCNVTEDNLGPDCYESMHAFKKIRTSTSGLRKSPNKWTKEENQKLAALVSSYGEKKWKRISAEMGGQKTGAQCAQHWKRVLSPEIRKGHWDEHEEDLLLRLVIQYGSCWKKIAKKIPQRTDIQCRYQYLKAKQSREVPWDAKEDESLIKKVMEMANCNFFQTFSDKGNTSNTDDNTMHTGGNTPPLRGAYGSPYDGSPSTTIKDGADEEELDSSGSGSGSDSKDDDGASMKSSGDFSKDAWNDDKHNVNMSDSVSSEAGTSSWRSTGKDSYSLSDVCANCHGSLGSHVNKIVWLEISEHMARLKLTSTLRTALECKTRFMELLGNKITFSNFGPNSNGLKNSGEMGGVGLRGSGGIDRTFHNGFTGDSTSRPNIGIQINNSNSKSNTTPAPPPPSSSTPNNINLTNCNNNNITINITNSYTTNNTLQNGLHLQQIGHSPLPVPNSAPVKPEGPILPHPSHLLSKTTLPIPLAKTPLPVPILSPAPSFPSFPHLSFPHVQATTPLKPAGMVAGPILGGTVVSRVSIASGLDSLAAVASILPREMLADYSQF